MLYHKNIYILHLLIKRNINFKQSFGELSLNFIVNILAKY